MSFKICRFGGTVLVTWFIEKTYWAMDAYEKILGFGEKSGQPEAADQP
ncbi:hypothetical protein [Comamonas sp. UBA7528]|nr:hypothetical protein [Comamonas sp. UBA7528]